MTTYQTDPGDAERDAPRVADREDLADEVQPEPAGEPSGERDRDVASDDDFDAEAATSGERDRDAASEDLDAEAPSALDVDDYESRWSEIQIGFVDEPRVAVESAGTLVAEMMDELTRAVEAELAGLAGRTSSDGGPTTEDLRMAFQGYRQLFDRLAAA
jgi:hypothetical protein